MPKVSICIPTFNNAAVIGDALRSAIAQDYENLEVVVIDNHSDDDTEQVVARVAAGDARIRYIRHSENIGMARNFSACVSFARGEYIKLLCADDALDPGCVGAMMKILEKHADVTLVGCARQLTDERLFPRGVAQARTQLSKIAGQEMIKECFFWGNRIGEPTAVMFRRVDAQRGFDDRYSQLVDLEMWFRLLQHGEFFFLPERLCSIRQHAKQATQENLQQGRIVEDKCRLFRDFASALADSASFVQKCLWDGRMALSLARAKSVGKLVDPQSIGEVFFPKIFTYLMWPAVKMLVHLGFI